jgi:hypothetical protein
MFELGIKYNLLFYICDILTVVYEIVDKKILMMMVVFDRNM